MAQKKNPTPVVTIRLTQDMVDRIDDITPLVAEEREFALKARITRSDLVRYLLLQGLEAVEHKSALSEVDDISEVGS